MMAMLKLAVALPACSDEEQLAALPTSLLAGREGRGSPSFCLATEAVASAASNAAKQVKLPPHPLEDLANPAT